MANSSDWTNPFTDLARLASDNERRVARNLVEALDQLQPFLPTDRTLHIMSFRHGATPGRNAVHVVTGSGYTDELRGVGSGDDMRLSSALLLAEIDAAAKWRARHSKAAYADAEFGPHCPAIMSYESDQAIGNSEC